MRPSIFSLCIVAFLVLPACLLADEINGNADPQAVGIDKPQLERNRNRLGLFFGPRFEIYQLGGEGFTASLPNGRGELYGGFHEIEILRGSLSWFTRLTHSRAKFDGLNGFTPGNAVVDQSSITGGIVFYPAILANPGTLGILMGYQGRRLQADLTSPNILFSPAQTLGPVFGLSVRIPHQDWEYATQIEVWFPHSYTEHETSTGSLRTILQGHAVLEVGRRLAPNVLVSIGLQVSGQWSQFYGAGHRGTLEARESFYSLGLPLKFEVLF